MSTRREVTKTMVNPATKVEVETVLDREAQERLEKGRKLNNSFPLGVNLWSHAPEVDSLVKVVVDSILKEEKKRRVVKRVAWDKCFNTVKVIVLNLYRAYYGGWNLYVAYSRERSGYSHKKVFNPNKVASTLTKYVKLLEACGYVEHHLGHYDRKNAINSRSSRMCATSKLIELFIKFGLRKEMPYQIIRRDSLIVLKDKNKKVIDFTPTPYTEKALNNLIRINQKIAEADISLDVDEEALGGLKKRLCVKNMMRQDGVVRVLDFNEKTLRRVFNNGSFKEGGRFYGGWWEVISKEYRKRILIDGHMVEEVDYSSIHPRILYGIRKVKCPKDPYVIHGLGPELRSVVKRALLVMINAKSELAAIKCLTQDYSAEELHGHSIQEIVDAIKKTHKPIQKYFCSGAGVELQRIDSDIAEEVMLRMNAAGYVVLPVHDSFIVKAGAGALILRRVMKEVMMEKVGVHAPVEGQYDVLMNLAEACSKSAVTIPVTP